MPKEQVAVMAVFNMGLSYSLTATLFCPKDSSFKHLKLLKPHIITLCNVNKGFFEKHNSVLPTL